MGLKTRLYSDRKEILNVYVIVFVIVSRIIGINTPH